MTNNQSIVKLIEMKLPGMADALKKQLNNPEFSQLSFEERVGILIDSEWCRRRNNQLDRLLKQANFRYPSACLEDIEYHQDRNLIHAEITTLGTCSYIQHKRNVIIMGATGAGKSYIACALGVSACRERYNCRYIRLPELFTEIELARVTQTYRKLMSQYKKLPLLLLDEWLLNPLSPTEARDLLEIVESRHDNCSTIFISQTATEGWHERIGEHTLADAILDRIIHRSYKIVIDGKDSMRKRHSEK
jgi:DNA replication protein DnaC